MVPGSQGYKIMISGYKFEDYSNENLLYLSCRANKTPSEERETSISMQSALDWRANW